MKKSQTATAAAAAATAVARSLAFILPQCPLKVGIDYGMQSPSWSIFHHKHQQPQPKNSSGIPLQQLTGVGGMTLSTTPPPTVFTYFVAQHARQDNVDIVLKSERLHHHIRCVLPASVHKIDKTRRNRLVSTALLSTVREHRRQSGNLVPCDVQFLIEQYAFHMQNSSSLTKLCEACGVLKSDLVHAGYTNIADNAAICTIKSHWGGSGACTKGDMLRAYTCRTGIDAEQLLSSIHCTAAAIRNSRRPDRDPPKPIEDIVDSLAIASLMMLPTTPLISEQTRALLQLPPLSVQWHKQQKQQKQQQQQSQPQPQPQPEPPAKRHCRRTTTITAADNKH
jgi:hypothetical protein